MSKRFKRHARAGRPARRLAGCAWLVLGLALLHGAGITAADAQTVTDTDRSVTSNTNLSPYAPAAPSKPDGDAMRSPVRDSDPATITALQAALMVQNCFSASIDGEMNETTVVAIERYRQAAGAGVAGPITAAVLLDRILAKPDIRCQTLPPPPRATDELVEELDDDGQTALVKAIQVKLRQHGCSPGRPDGRFGKQTRAALRRALGRSAAGAEPSPALLARLEDIPRSTCAERSKTVRERPATKKRTARIEKKPARRVRPKRARAAARPPRQTRPPRVRRRPSTTRSATNRAACREYKRCRMISGNDVKHSLGGICPSRPKGC